MCIWTITLILDTRPLKVNGKKGKGLGKNDNEKTNKIYDKKDKGKNKNYNQREVHLNETRKAEQARRLKRTEGEKAGGEEPTRAGVGTRARDAAPDEPCHRWQIPVDKSEPTRPSLKTWP